MKLRKMFLVSQKMKLESVPWNFSHMYCLLQDMNRCPLGIWKALTQHSWDVWKSFMWNALIYLPAGNRASRLPYVLPMRFIHLMTLQNICGRCCLGAISFELAITYWQLPWFCTKILRICQRCQGHTFDPIGSHTKKERHSNHRYLIMFSWI